MVCRRSRLAATRRQPPGVFPWRRLHLRQPRFQSAGCGRAASTRMWECPTPAERPRCLHPVRLDREARLEEQPEPRTLRVLHDCHVRLEHRPVRARRPAGDQRHLRYDYGNYYASKSFYDPIKNRWILWDTSPPTPAPTRRLPHHRSTAARRCWTRRCSSGKRRWRTSSGLPSTWPTPTSTLMATTATS
ncbi:hypothetical protein BRADI_1g50436v3 [Brachypodium distachyon]|uniref:Uncharacterized protein n=1 Tax=Brachypodium distachyon TaxID=15368 RepID=A0A2K2DQQ6_BRADI|nr:hypothetical protein BRADI_1g50436v3 [Brachypodium distachyon]